MTGDILKALSYSKATDVLDFLEGDEKRFTDIEKGLSLNSNIVNMRLKDLRAAGLVDKVDRGTYRLTDKGEEAADILNDYGEL